jgi:phospholipid/cholesterol/gamma-HCH transport system ATP-binding protein
MLLRKREYVDQRTEESAEVAEASPFGPHQTALLDQAAEYEYQLHEGAVEFAEEQPGYFWSIRVAGVHKAFGRSRILRGVDLGIPERMIMVILGPSGTGKSVMIKHLIGLMYPDQGDVIVHGESLRHMTQSRLLDTRKKFGILFQDGAPVRLDVGLQQRRVPAAAAHRSQRD